MDERVSGFREWPRPLLDSKDQPKEEERNQKWFDAADPKTCVGCPVNIKAIRSFLGALGYNRRFINNFSIDAAPLYAYTK
jgi:hypothetical protein